MTDELNKNIETIDNLNEALEMYINNVNEELNELKTMLSVNKGKVKKLKQDV